jgi:hypothetical protein
VDVVSPHVALDELLDECWLGLLSA